MNVIADSDRRRINGWALMSCFCFNVLHRFAHYFLPLQSPENDIDGSIKPAHFELNKKDYPVWKCFEMLKYDYYDTICN